MEKLNFEGIDRITMIACGTAYLSCFVAKYWMEEIVELIDEENGFLRH